MKFYPYSTQDIDKADVQAVCEALQSSFLTQGERVLAFENEVAKYVGANFALALNSATSALYVAYRAVLDTKLSESKKNCEIFAITSPISFVATCNMMLQNAITPIFASILPNGNIDPKSVRQILKNHPMRKNIKLLVSVDYAGQSVDCTKLREIADEFGLIWISDSSHAFGARFSESSEFQNATKSHKIGSFADITIFSFHAIKTITTAEGGAMVTNHKQIFERAKLIANHGVQKAQRWEYDCVLDGFNFRMHELSAALGLSQILKVDDFVARRAKIAHFYNDFFTQNAAHLLDILPTDSRCKSSHHLYAILLKPHLWDKKAQIFDALHKAGIGAQVHYRPIFDFHIYKNLARKNFELVDSAQIAIDFYTSELSIPCAQNMGIDDAQVVAQKLIEILKTI